jgi:hypothetical protein
VAPADSAQRENSSSPRVCDAHSPLSPASRVRCCGPAEIGRCLESEVANALIVTEKGRGYRLRAGKDGVQVKGLGEVGLVFGHEAG